MVRVGNVIGRVYFMTVSLCVNMEVQPQFCCYATTEQNGMGGRLSFANMKS